MHQNFGDDSPALKREDIRLLLASLMERSGGTQALVTLAHVMTRGTRSGPGLTTVVSSGLFGMASGSGVADVAAVGTANIPAMKQAGQRQLDDVVDSEGDQDRHVDDVEEHPVTAGELVPLDLEEQQGK